MGLRRSQKQTETLRTVSESGKAKKIIVTLDGRALNLEFDISDENLIASVISSLGKFVDSFPGIPL